MNSIIAFIFVFSIMVFFHELGHFLSAKAFGVKVYKFAFGFGPKIFGFKKNETEYNICLVPLGGYVKMAGEFGQTEKESGVEEEEVSGRFDKKPVSVRALIVAMGPLMNIITSILIFSLIFLLNGIPMTTTVIESVLENGPAAESGILRGDEIIQINSIEVNNTDEIAKIISQSIGKELNIVINRDDIIYEKYITPEYNEEYERGMIGISFTIETRKLNVFSSLGEGIKTTIFIIKMIFTNTLEMITGKIPVEVAGPLGIAQMTGEFARLGFMSLLYFTAILSIFIGIFNLIPIPILDGGQIILLCIEKIRGKPLETKKMNLIYLIGISLMLILFIFATYSDITRIFFK